MIFQKSKELGLKPRITYPTKLSIILQGKKWSFNKIEDFQAFLMKRPELNRKFDFQKQESREARNGKQEREIKGPY